MSCQLTSQWMLVELQTFTGAPKGTGVEFWESQRWLLESEDALEADWHSSHRQGRGRAVAGASVLLGLAVSQMCESDMDQVDAAEGSQIRRDSAQKRAARWIETALAMRG